MRRLAIVLVLLLIVVFAAGGAWLEGEWSRPFRGYAQAQVFVDIPRGTPRWDIAAMLQSDGIIRSQVAFLLLSRWHRRSVLQAGEYRFDHPMTPQQVFTQIAGGHIYVHTVRVLEGWTMFDIANELEQQGLCRREDFLKIAHNTLLVHDIAPSAPSLEGFFFPATYEFTKSASPEEIAATMVRHFREEWSKLQTAAPAITDPETEGSDPAEAGVKHVSPEPLSPEEVVTLASLVERETPQPQERPVVASVFYNRLRLGLRLQCDPTVQYALDLEGKLGQNVTPEDLHVSSPYNTYEHSGLPPGPIANPGDASLRAALEPAQTKYLYFVANASGGHLFSRTLAEHNRNVARYRRILAGESPEPPPPPQTHPKAAHPKSSKHRRSSKKTRSRT